MDEYLLERWKVCAEEIIASLSKIMKATDELERSKLLGEAMQMAVAHLEAIELVEKTEKPPNGGFSSLPHNPTP